MRLFTTIALGILGLAAGIATAGAQTLVTYQCQDGFQFVAAFIPGERFARMQIGGKSVALSKRPTVTGSRYVKGDITLRITKTKTTLKRGKRTTECSAL
jgi:hypothetical protein